MVDRDTVAKMVADMELLMIHGDDLDQCETCGVWLTTEERFRSDCVTLCPFQAYGGPRFPNEPCYRDRPWRHAHRSGFDQARAVDAIMEPARPALAETGEAGNE